ncbi:MAG: hypothetical protein KA801_15140 [Syntrophorhabdaceae bacterium]|nr:hypothetical protein [Syntrophorhabdaceae bacterium]
MSGLGRIGRAVLKILLETPGAEIKGIKDLVPTESLNANWRNYENCRL